MTRIQYGHNTHKGDNRFKNSSYFGNKLKIKITEQEGTSESVLLRRYILYYFGQSWMGWQEKALCKNTYVHKNICKDDNRTIYLLILQSPYAPFKAVTLSFSTVLSMQGILDRINRHNKHTGQQSKDIGYFTWSHKNISWITHRGFIGTDFSGCTPLALATYIKWSQMGFSWLLEQLYASIAAHRFLTWD